MSRSFGASDLVTLPRFTVSTALGCAAQVIAATTARTVPATAAGALQELTQCHAALQQAAVSQAPQPSGDGAAGKLADQLLDAAWGGTLDLIHGTLRIPDEHGRHAHATALRNALYPAGLDFTQLKFIAQWAESDIRLKRVDEQNLSPHFQALGLGWALDAIRKHHVHYGKVTGATEQQAYTAAPPQVREPFDALVDALRDYVLKVSASVDRKQPATKDMADALLAPLAEFTTARAASSEVAAGQPATGTPV